MKLKDIMEKKWTTGSKLLIWVAIFGFAFLGFTVLSFAGLVGVLGIPLMLSLIVFWVLLIIYHASFHPYIVSAKWLEKLGREDVTEDIHLDSYTLPASKIYCGKKAFACEKPVFTVFPYEDLAWVYLKATFAYRVELYQTVILHFKDGKKFELQVNEDEFNWMVSNLIQPHYPSVIVGYGKEQEAMYRKLKAEYKNKK